MHVRVGEGTGDRCLVHRLRKTVDPALGVPLVGVRTPDLRVAVDGFDTDDDGLAFVNGQLLGDFTVLEGDGFAKGDSDLLLGAATVLSASCPIR